jgi:hypothetical protein
MLTVVWKSVATIGRRPAVTSTPPFIVVVQTADDLEDLRNIVYAAANNIRGDSTEHWDEERHPGTAFYFVAWEAAFAFTAHCARTGIPYRNE